MAPPAFHLNTELVPHHTTHLSTYYRPSPIARRPSPIAHPLTHHPTTQPPNHPTHTQSDKTKHDQNKTQIRRLLVGSLKSSKHEFGSKAFIVFKEYTPATVAPQVLHSAEPGVMHVSCAPDERDIFWGNMDKVSSGCGLFMSYTCYTRDTCYVRVRDT